MLSEIVIHNEMWTSVNAQVHFVEKSDNNLVITRVRIWGVEARKGVLIVCFVDVVQFGTISQLLGR